MLLSLAMRLLTTLLLLLPLNLHCQTAAPVIVIEQTRKIDVAIEAIGGSEGPTATKVLTDDLNRSGVCRVVPAESAAFVLSGSLTPTGLSGRAVPKAGGAAVVDKSFSGDARRVTHLFADAVVEAALAIARAEVGSEADACRLAVIGMGKCGARELNYVSDVDVIFVAEAEADRGRPLASTMQLPTPTSCSE